MPKDRRVNSSSFDRAMVSPYYCNSKISDRDKGNSSSPHAGDKKEWEEARCSICMEHPHNAVLLICTSYKKGCRPFICDTSYRHSNCLDQFRKSAAALSLQTPSQNGQCKLVCPLCRGLVTGWDVIQPVRKFMNSKTRSCSLETCDFHGNYAELRKHARLKHPSERPSEANPARQSNWTSLEQQEIGDALAHQSDDEYDFDLDGLPSWDDDFWGEAGFFDFPSGMPDIEDQVIDEMFSCFCVFTPFPSSPDEALVDLGTAGSSERLQSTVLPTISNSRSYNHVASTFHSSRSISSHHSEEGVAITRSRSGYHSENDSTNLRSTSSSRSRRVRESGSIVPSSRSSLPRRNARASSRSRSSNHREDLWPSSRAARSRSEPVSSRLPHSSYWHRGGG